MYFSMLVYVLVAPVLGLYTRLANLIRWLKYRLGGRAAYSLERQRGHRDQYECGELNYDECMRAMGRGALTEPLEINPTLRAHAVASFCHPDGHVMEVGARFPSQFAAAQSGFPALLRPLVRLVLEYRSIKRFMKLSSAAKGLDKRRLSAGFKMQFGPQELGELVDNGVLVRPRHRPRRPVLECRLAEPEERYALAGSYRWILQDIADSSEGALKVNERMWLQRDGQVPAPIARRFPVLPPVPEPPLLWVESPITGFVMPYQVDGAQLELLTEMMQTGDPGVMEDHLPLLRQAAIVVPESVAGRGHDWLVAQTTTLATDRERPDESLILVPSLLSPLQMAAVRRYFRALFDHGGTMDGYMARRTYFYRDPVSDYLSLNYKTLLSAIFAQSVQTTFTFTSLYYGQGFLRRHLDRPQCRWNASILVDRFPTDPGDDDHWSFHVEVNGQESVIRLDHGQCAIYSGQYHPHWRPPLPEGHTVTSLSMFFVPADFAGRIL